MTDQDEAQKFCLEFADFPGADLPWLIEKANAIEETIGERLPEAFAYCSVVAHPEIDGFRLFFQENPDGAGLDDTVPLTLIEIIHEIAAP